jgi:hypothetical protein
VLIQTSFGRNMKISGLLLPAIFISGGCATIPEKDASVIWPNKSAFKAAQAVADADVSPDTVYRIIDIEKSRLLKVTLGTTTKGNGVISIPGLAIRVYDQHNDGLVFDDGGGLTCEWRSDVPEGYPMLLISGVAIHYDEKGNNIVQRNEVSAVFRYSRVRKSYHAESCSPEIDYWSSK